MPLDRFITIIVRLTNNNDMETITPNQTYVKSGTSGNTSSKASKVHKCHCLPRIPTQIYTIHSSYNVIKALYVLFLSLFCLVFCVLLLTIVRARRPQRPIFARAYIHTHAQVFCLCRSTLLSIAKRKKPPSHTKVFLSIAEQSATMMTQQRYCNGRKMKEIIREGRKRK